MEQISHAAWVLSAPLDLLLAAVSAFVVLRLILAGLAWQYWPVALYLSVEVVTSWLNFKYPREVLTVYQGNKVLVSVIAALVLWRLARDVFDNYPALKGFVARAVPSVIVAAIVLAGINFWLNPADLTTKSAAAHITEAAARSVDTAVLTFLFALGIFAGWFPVKMKRNVARLLIGFMVLFSTDWAKTMLDNAMESLAGLWSFSAMWVLLTLIVYWGATLGRAGEEQVSSPMPVWNPARLMQTTNQLNQIQVQLARRGF